MADSKPWRRARRGPIGGVCTGLADSLGVDPLWVQLACIFLPGGMGFYILLWILIPMED